MSKGRFSRPRRTCAGCGRKAPQKDLMRIAVHSGRVKFDPQRRIEGRGAYLCPGQNCLELLLGSPRRQRLFRQSLGKDAWAGLTEVPGSSSRSPERIRGDI